MSSRSVYDTPARPRKRARTTTLAPRRLFGSVSKPSYRVPRSLLPEMKQYTVTALGFGDQDYASSSVIQDMTQGDDGNQFVGTKITAKRLRVLYNYSNFTAGAVRMLVYIPKDASDGNPPVSAIHHPVDTHRHTVLYDRILNTRGGDAILSGHFDVKLNHQIETLLGGTTAVKNNIRIFVYSAGNGLIVRTITAYALWYTDA